MRRAAPTTPAISCCSACRRRSASRGCPPPRPTACSRPGTTASRRCRTASGPGRPSPPSRQIPTGCGSCSPRDSSGCSCRRPNSPPRAAVELLAPLLRVAEQSGSPVLVHPGPVRAARPPPTPRPGGLRWWTTRRSSPRPGGRGTPPVARTTLTCGSVSSRGPAWHPSSTSASPPAAAVRCGWTTVRSSIPRRTDREEWTPSSGSWVSTPSFTALTGPMSERTPLAACPITSGRRRSGRYT